MKHFYDVKPSRQAENLPADIYYSDNIIVSLKINCAPFASYDPAKILFADICLVNYL